MVRTVIMVLVFMVMLRTWLFITTLYISRNSYQEFTVQSIEQELKQLREIKRQREKRRSMR